MRTILLPTDFTADSDLAFVIACGIARDRACELIVLHVIRPENCSKYDRDDCELDRDGELFECYWSRFKRLRESADGVPTSFRVKVGRLVETILDVAEADCCDLIILGVHPRNFIHRHCQKNWMPQSYSHRLVRWFPSRYVQFGKIEERQQRSDTG